MKTATCVLWVTLVLLLTIAASAQLTVDATGPARRAKREATTGTGGGVGRKLPLRVSIAVPNPSPEADGRTVVEFTLTNLGKEPLTIPVCPHPGDLEPADPQVNYTLTDLALLVNFTEKGKMRIPLGGASLYGSPEFPETLASLRPGESIRVLTKVLLPTDPREGSSFVGYAGLVTRSIYTNGSRISSIMQEIGYAVSPPYTANALLGRPE
jgi:hypothetical protein